MTSNLPIGTKVETTRPFIGVGMYVNHVRRYGNIPVGRFFTITDREDVEPELVDFFGTYVYDATATVNGETHDVSFWENQFDDGSVRVSGQNPKAPPVEVSIDAKKSELEDDIFTGDDLQQGARVIRIGEKNNWIYNREELEKWWKKNPNTNPLVSGTQKMAEGTKIEYGTLNILPGGGRRTKKSKRRVRKTRRSTRGH